MKKLLSIILAISAFAATLNACAFFKKEIEKPVEKSTYRTDLAQAVEINNRTVMFKTPDGNKWVWNIEQGECFEQNKLYNITFDSLGTQGIRDDIIVKITEK